MKKNFKAIIFMIFIFALFIPTQVTVQASEFASIGPKTNIEVVKPWTVSFNKSLNTSSVNTTNIKVIGEDNKEVEINVKLANSNKSIIVQAVNSYEFNKTYTLIITQKVMSTNGSPLAKEIRMNFTTKSQPTNSNALKVVLDAGHGGNDSGAVGSKGTKEKDVVLPITLKVGNILAKNGVEVIYTRTSDITQSLQQKCDVSNAAKPKYFVSIHANSFTSPTANGIETFYSSGNAEGLKLAQAVQAELVKETGKTNRGVKTAGFYVLNNTDAVAILVETLFLSNPEEEILLYADAYQDKLAKAISTGILKCLGITNIKY